MGRPRKSIEDVFDQLTIPEPNSGCLLWLGAVGSDGYPLYSKNRINRWVCEKYHDAVGEYLACHKCHNILCVSDNHLYVGTPLSNMADAQVRGTFSNLHTGRDKMWASKSKKERQEITSNGVKGIIRYLNGLSREELSKKMAKAARARWDRKKA